MNITNAKRAAKKLFKIADRDGSGLLEFREWCNATMDMKSLVSDERLRAVFSEFDKDGNGTMDK